MTIHGAIIEQCMAALSVGWRQINLRRADLRRADLNGADLSGADLRRADLRGASLSGADLSGASLSGASLRGADLRRADLRGASLSGADLRGADLSGADLRGAIGLRLDGMPDPVDLRDKVAAHIKQHPELHNQSEWGDGSSNPSCGTPCCVAGWACHLGGGTYGLEVEQAAIRLLWVDGKPLPSFSSGATRESILEALRS
jgi:hypothetical protein